MIAQLEPDLTLTDIQLPCVQASFTNNNFTNTQDDRGRALIFESIKKPAVFIEVVKTLPGKIRGNHVHKDCEEVLNVVSGKLAVYLLCNCEDKHVFRRIMNKNETIVTPKGVPHALQALEDTEVVILFDKDPREDRDRVKILKF